MSPKNSSQKKPNNFLATNKKSGRKEKRKARLYNRHVIVKKINDQIRRLSKQKNGVPIEDESIMNRIECLRQESDRLRIELSEAKNNLEQLKNEKDELGAQLELQLGIGTSGASNYSIVTNESSNESDDEMDDTNF
ncbi:20610_t:CDS:2 [Dentiscutata erythropus]|uniref:20610_t:CDS:1 n=1 Tax=Dentiscutata erythropus TaxID=1348616 RepID=A0A9N9P6Y9_9GLOM|nr:20610_t:CDS:2 [Dentiscutata erythropus]